MKLKMLFYVILTLIVSVTTADASTILKNLGRYPVHQPELTDEESLCTMMQKPQVQSFIEKGLKKTTCPGLSQCSDLYKDILELFPKGDTCSKNPKFSNNKKYDKGTKFYWMMFRKNKGKGDIDLTSDIIWGGDTPIDAFEFSINKDGNNYTFSVPKKCGNLALLKVTECPDNPCKDCPGENCPEQCNKCQNCPGDNCPEECKPRNLCEKCPGDDCPEQCNKCQNCPDGPDCPEECKPTNPCEDCPGENCPEGCLHVITEIKWINLCEKKNCNQCSNECVDNPDAKDCPQQCGECKAIGCLRIVDKPIPCDDCTTLRCKECSDECVRNPYRKGCPTEKCLECKQRDCIRIVPVEIEKPCPDNCRQKCATNHYGEDCQKCRRLNCIEPCPTEKCPDECLKECKEEPNGTECQKCNKLNCIQPAPSPFHFIADLGYYRQSDPADYLFGRVGIEYNLSENANWLEGVSLLTMIGAAPKIGGSDGDSAFLLDVIAQYNWLQSSLRGFTGLGLGGWFTSGDVEDDSKDIDLDIIANIGVRVLDDPNISIFLEMRNAVDELDSISEYGRFGAGVRFQF